jgi:endonuclease YncB( thermonuclease family)
MSLFVGVVCVLAISASTQNTNFTGKVVRVADGDTFTILTDGNTQIRVRIYGIDAPETGQAYSDKSRLYLANMIAGRKVVVMVQSIDQYGRKVAKVKTDSIADVGLEMIKAGFAWHYSYIDNTKEYGQAERDARAKQAGLWADKNPVNPYE